MGDIITACTIRICSLSICVALCPFLPDKRHSLRRKQTKHSWKTASPSHSACFPCCTSSSVYTTIHYTDQVLAGISVAKHKRCQIASRQTRKHRTGSHRLVHSPKRHVKAQAERLSCSLSTFAPMESSAPAYRVARGPKGEEHAPDTPSPLHASQP